MSDVAKLPQSQKAAVTAVTACQDLLGLIKHIKATMAVTAEVYGLTSIQLYALHAIKDDQVTMGMLAQTLHCDASNVTGIVDRLVESSLISRRESEHDRRVKLLSLTDKGRRVVRSIEAELPERLGCTRLSVQEMVMLGRVISKLRNSPIE